MTPYDYLFNKAVIEYHEDGAVHLNTLAKVTEMGVEAIPFEHRVAAEAEELN